VWRSPRQKFVSHRRELWLSVFQTTPLLRLVGGELNDPLLPPRREALSPPFGTPKRGGFFRGGSPKKKFGSRCSYLPRNAGFREKKSPPSGNNAGFREKVCSRRKIGDPPKLRRPFPRRVPKNE